MEEDQQFCLRWNNHQSTLISVFDTLLENGTLVDCTLAAEGKFLKAHKVVLSACSPYFATLLSEQYDKHPIFILKDVKYQELRAMMDYMYRGEVNISQDQLAALLKAAESLQIKGLSDNRCGGGNQKPSSAEHKQLSVPGKLTGASGGYTLEQTKRARLGPSSVESQELSGSREGSSSPTSRRRKKVRRRSVDNVMADNHDNSNSSQSMQVNSSVPSANTQVGTITSVASIVPAAVSSLATSANLQAANITKKTDSLTKLGNTDAITTGADNEHADDNADKSAGTVSKKEQNHHKQRGATSSKIIVNESGKETEIVIEPKSEYDDGNDETVEDLTLDDEDMGLEDLDHTAGPSHGGEGSSQGYAQWQVDRSQDEVFMAAQEAQQRDPQDVKYQFEQTMIEGSVNGLDGAPGERFPCGVCGKSYLRKRHLQRHMRDECIGIPPRFKCDLCPSRFRRKYHMVRHLTSKHGIPPPVQTSDGPENLSVKKENYENDNAAAAAAFAAMANPENGPIDAQNGGLRYGLTGAIAAASLFPQIEERELNIKREIPDSPSKAAALEDDWKMKLSLQLISNSLLKERLMNAMPFAYNNN